MQVAALPAAQRAQISQLRQQPGNGGQRGFSQILQSGFQGHFVTNSVTNSEQSRDARDLLIQAEVMKVSRIDFPRQGENNRETHTTDRCCSLDAPQHFDHSRRAC
jgi:hypothetical protein